MRRMLPGSKLFWAGLLTLPVMAVGLLAIPQPSHAKPRRVTRFVQTSDGQRAVVFEAIDDGELPAQESLLAGDMPDAAETAKTAQLREKLWTVIDEKAALLNVTALEAEITLHERRITELKAIKEFQQLQRGLQELGDKYPDSDAGRQAKELLNLMRQRETGPAPIYESPTPIPDDGFRNGFAPVPFPGSRIPTPSRRPDTFATPEQPLERRVPDPNEEIPFGSSPDM